MLELRLSYLGNRRDINYVNPFNKIAYDYTIDMILPVDLLLLFRYFISNKAKCLLGRGIIFHWL